MRRKYLIILIIIFGVVSYFQMMIVRTFNTVTVQHERTKVELIPESPTTFGGLSWGLLRFDENDQLFLRVIGNIGAGKEAKISLKKNGEVITVACRADGTGLCYETIQRPDVTMLGNFTCSVTIAGSSFNCAGTFKRRTKPIFLIYEAIMSV